MTKPAIFSLTDLVIKATATGSTVIDTISLDVSPGEVVALIGESGSGKTTLSLTALGHVRPGLAVTSGTANLNGRDLLSMSDGQLRKLRGSEVAYVSQSAAASFNPAFRLDRQVAESAILHGKLSRSEALARARSLFRDMGLPDPDGIGRRFPHQVSGGQLQRFMAAMALMEDPVLVVFDEPTTALDVTTQVGVLKAFKEAIKARNTAALYVSHDLAVVAQMADRVIVLRHGKMVEQGPTADILHHPKHEYTRKLLAACQKWDAAPEQVEVLRKPRAADAQPLMSVRSLSAGYGRGEARIKAIRDIDLTVKRGHILAIIGESGSGKSTLAKVLTGLHPSMGGELRLDGHPLAADLRNRTLEERRRVQLVMQMPDTALNPFHTVGGILDRVLKRLRGLDRKGRQARVAELLEQVRLPQSYVSRRSTQLSGGEKQRVNLARALAADPEVLICDEITAALDTLVAESVLDLLRDLRDRLGLGIILISHDLATVATFADEIAVMHRGDVVEKGPPDLVLNHPVTSYTRQLVASVPELRIGWLENILIQRETADAADVPLRAPERLAV